MRTVLYLMLFFIIGGGIGFFINGLLNPVTELKPIEEAFKIKVKKIKDNAIIPKTAHRGDAGFDLYACLDEDVIIAPGETKKIGTGLQFQLLNGSFGAVFARSGLATNNGLRPANCVGVCDAPYRGEYIVALHNDSKDSQRVCNGDRIAQLVILPFVPAEFYEVEELDDTERGDGGFGSTGV